MKPKRKVNGTVRVNSYEVLTRAVNEGIAYGWSRAHKHTDSPDPEAVKEAIETAVLGSICEVFVFWEEGDA